MEAFTKSMNRLSWVIVLAMIAGVDTTVWALLLFIAVCSGIDPSLCRGLDDTSPYVLT